MSINNNNKNTKICLLRLNAMDETGTGSTHENEKRVCS